MHQLRPVPTAPLRVLIADDHEMVLEMFAHYLSAGAGMAVATAPDLEVALDLMAAEGPFDVILLDLNMPGMNGIAGLRRAVKAAAGAPVAILTGAPAARMVDEILSAGASGIVLKTTPARSLGAAIRFMQAGERYLPMELMRAQKAAATGGGRLTQKEGEVMALLAEGRANKDIANALGLAEPTVKMHVKSICKKLGARNRTQAVVAARNLGIV